MVRKNGSFRKAADAEFGSFVIARRNEISFYGFVFGWGEEEDLDKYIINLENINALPYQPGQNERLFVLDNCQFVVNADPASLLFGANGAIPGHLAISENADYLMVPHGAVPIPINMVDALVQIGAAINAFGYATSWKLVQTQGDVQTTIFALNR